MSGAIDEKEFIAKATEGFQFELGGVGEAHDVVTSGDGGGRATADYFRADGEVELIDQAGVEQGGVQFSSAFAEQAADVPMFPQDRERGREIDLFVAAEDCRIEQVAEFLQPAAKSFRGGYHKNRRKPVLENGGARIDGAGAADNDAQAVVTEAVRAAHFFETLAASPQQHFVQVQRACAGHDGVGGRAELVEVFHVAFASERGDGAVRRGDFAIGGHRHVHEHKWTPGVMRGWWCVNHFGQFVSAWLHSMNIASP